MKFQLHYMEKAAIGDEKLKYRVMTKITFFDIQCL